MKNQFVPYELALKLKELGFDKECFMEWYLHETGFSELVENSKYLPQYVVKAPLWQQAFDWFRKNNMIGIVNIMSSELNDNKFDMYVCTNYTDWDSDDYMNYSDGVLYNTYEEARQACLEKLIELCQKN